MSLRVRLGGREIAQEYGKAPPVERRPGGLFQRQPRIRPAPCDRPIIAAYPGCRGDAMKLDGGWFTEIAAEEGVALSLQGRRLQVEQTPFQTVEIYETDSFG